ncbi:sodium:phosphate symporter [Halorhodospira abdelmalekii]|uniref:Na/Pi cotransporter family protein n=1 Tax=Halorhodospira abdelmalekii TaxID=421629 RepID=UPI001908728A|nr:Na/Pi cotransporter family protein [Halorhodospira abdelmalekii]MBK1736078.1 sodium:phosphate symporter [Halorhodospira abdelmalekii]
MSRTDLTSQRISANAPGHRIANAPAWLHGVYAGLCLYLFLAALNAMGSGLGTFGAESDFLIRAFEYGENPFVAFLGAVFVTAIVQSSSFTSALIVTLVATGEMSLGTAVFAIMGANIGTSVTALIVALANLRIRRTFRRSFTAALLHDFFNIFTVAVIFPLEWISSVFNEEGRGLVTQAAAGLAQALGLPEVARPDNPVRILTSPIVNALDGIGGWLMPSTLAQGLLVAFLGLLLMLASLLLMVRNLRGALLHYMDSLFRSYFFRTDLRAYCIGLLATVGVQSSTITTSLMVPLAGAGVVPMKRVFPFMIGSNLGTTVTSVLAATANPAAAALTVAIFHVLFNLLGSVIWYPLRALPIRAANWYGRLAGRSTIYAFLFLFLLFLVLPLTGLLLTELLGVAA